MKQVGVLTSRTVTSILCLVTALSLLSPAASYAGEPATHPNDLGAGVPITAHKTNIVRDSLGYVRNEMLVKLNNPAAVSLVNGKLAPVAGGLQSALLCYQLNVVEEVAPGTYKLGAPQGADLDVAGAAALLKQSGLVEYAGPNHYYYLQATPNDEQYVAGQQWGLTQIKSEQAWDITTGNTDIVVAVLDTGAALDHPDLQDKIVGGYDFVHNSNRPQDDEGHGTQTSGIIGAVTNNRTGVAGVSWGARLMPIKVCTSQGRCSEEAIAQGIRWAVDHGARIINASLGGDEDAPVLRDAARYAIDRNVLIVASAGNTPDGKDNFPAAYDGVLSVGATGRSDTYTGFSSFGRFVDVTAPGVGILSTGWDNGNNTYTYGNGTSFSGPFVAGLAALVLSVNPSLNAQQIAYVIEDSSDDLGDPGPDVHYGTGRVNALRAVTMARQGPPPPRTATPATQPTNTPRPATTPPPTATSAPKQPPGLQVDSATVKPGGLIAIIGSGFGANELVDLSLLASNSDLKPLGTAQTTQQGTFRAEVGVPQNLLAGKVILSAIGGKSGLRASVALMVQAGEGGTGQSVVKGVVRGGNGAGVTVTLKPSFGVSGPERTTQPDANGAYSFDKLTSGVYSLVVTVGGSVQAGPFSVQVNGNLDDVKTIDVTLPGTSNTGAARPPAFNRVQPVGNTATQHFFPEVGHTLKGAFLKYWQANGGLAIFGYPLSEEFQETSATDGKTYTVQYFERNRFELHPEFAGTPNEVLLGLLGVVTTKDRNFAPGIPLLTSAGYTYFKETQHSLSGPFLRYWQQHGGLAIFGYPISEPMTENGFLTQYFERNRFELHPEFAGTPNEVLLGLLGVEALKGKGWITP